MSWLLNERSENSSLLSVLVSDLQLGQSGILLELSPAVIANLGLSFVINRNVEFRLILALRAERHGSGRRFECFSALIALFINEFTSVS